jgi:hypothetical protein
MERKPVAGSGTGGGQSIASCLRFPIGRQEFVGPVAAQLGPPPRADHPKGSGPNVSSWRDADVG